MHVRRACSPEEIHIAQQSVLQHARDRLVQCARPLTAAEHEYRAPLCGQSEFEARRPCVHGAWWRDRISEYEDLRALPRCQPEPRFRESEVDLSRAAREQSGRESGKRVLFLERCRDARALRAPHDRPHRVPTGADDDGGPLLVQHASRGPPRAHGDQRPARVAPPRVAIQRLHRQEMKRKGVPGENLCFNAAGRSHQYDIVSLIGSDAREGERGHEVASSTPTGYQDLHAARLERPTLANTPVAARATISDDRPYDMNGSVTPAAGITARLTPMCTTTLSPIITLIPVASSCPKGSLAWRAIRKPSQTNVPNSSAMASTPRKPHSSPMVEKMKSEYAYGR